MKEESSLFPGLRAGDTIKFTWAPSRLYYPGPPDEPPGEREDVTLPELSGVVTGFRVGTDYEDWMPRPYWLGPEDCEECLLLVTSRLGEVADHYVKAIAAEEYFDGDKESPVLDWLETSGLSGYWSKR